jgi:YidC/Oxa1 family membrane protein insertase
VNENRNMILAVVLSALVLVGWGVVTKYFFPAANPPATKVERGHEVVVPPPHAAPAAVHPAAIRDRRAVIAETPRVAIATPHLSGSINLKGARIDDLVLSTERETIARNSPPVRLFSPSDTADAYFAGFGWSGQGLAAPGPDTVWRASGTRLTPTTPVTLSWDNGQGQLFQILLSVDDDYLFTVEQRITNRGAGPVAARPFGLVNRIGPSHDPTAWTNHVGPVGVFNGAANYENDFKDVSEAGSRAYQSQGGWIGFGDKYWLAALVPDQAAQVTATFRHNAASNAFQADVAPGQSIVPPGQTLRTVTHLFAGAKEVRLLENYSTALGTPLERAIDWGWFRWFMKPIFSLLVWLFHQIGNFGVAIICLVVIVRLLLFPIAQKQFASMAKMRALQPKMKALQERHKGDRPKLQEEMMKLYREEKANPAAGCLPILLQIPIMYALYKTLLVSVEMRHEPFVLWIRDLSAPDPLTPVNLFGYLPFTPPHILAIGVLPILVGISIWMQQKLAPTSADPMQQQIMGLMPWVLMFIMAPFAAGLQLYWVTNNILSILQQRILYARNPELKAAMTAPAKR